MRLVIVLLLSILPAVAAAAPFAEPQSFVLGGHFAFESSDVDSGMLVREEQALRFGPTLAYFPWRYVALRASPGFSLTQRVDNPNGATLTRTQNLFGLSLGPSVYLPMGEALYFTAGGQVGFQLGYLSQEQKHVDGGVVGLPGASGQSGGRRSTTDGDIDGFSYGAEAGLAFLVNGTGLIEMLVSWDTANYSISGDLISVEEDQSGLSVGARLSIAL